MKKKLIHINQKNFLKCDNRNCAFVLESKAPDRSDESYINEPCPNCGENLLTKEDHLRYQKVMRFIDFLNHWFGWLGTYEDDPKNIVAGDIDCHEEIKINHY